MSQAAETVDAKPHHAVVSLRVTGGFLGGATLQFADGLNCLIGGRGAGKTTALEFLRFGLGLMPDPKANGQRHRAIDGLVKANLGGGRLGIELRTKTGIVYVARRGYGEGVEVLNGDGKPVPITLDRDLIFTADVFSQNEIEEIASSHAAQLAILDRFNEAECAEIRRDLDECARQLERTAAELRRVDDDIEGLTASASQVAAFQERLKGLVEVTGPDVERINAAHERKGARVREDKLSNTLLGAIQKSAQELAAAELRFRSSVNSQVLESLRQGPNAEVLVAMQAAANNYGSALSDVIKTAEAARCVAEAAIREAVLSLAERHAVQEAEYRALVAESDEHGGRATERATLQAALANALAAANELAGRQKHRHELMGVRAGLLKRASELRDRRFAMRKRVAGQLCSAFSSIRVTVTQAADLTAYRELLADSLKGAGLKHGQVAERLSQVFLPTELGELVMSRDHRELARRAGLDEERARKVIDALRAGGTLLDIEAVDIDDRPCIELLDGTKYKESHSLSTGQRCTTILPILLVQSERPLLIDQPEDNLDNAFVFDTVVRALREVRRGRQVIFVTHNPNIPVLGEADRVFVFASDGQHATLAQVGTVDECKEQIEDILEGGREAFLQRKARYGH